MTSESGRGARVAATERAGHGYRVEPGVADESQGAWTARSRIVLTPIAAPSILGLFGYGSAMFMVASLLAGWWGVSNYAFPILAPFVLFYGGVAQLLAGMWAYKARDGVATAMHGTWGAFWLGWGLLVLLVQGGVLPSTALASRPFGFWFIVLAVVTIFGALAAFGDNLGVFLVFGLLAAGAACLAAGYVGAGTGWVRAGGWVLVASSAAAFYTGAALMLAGAFRGRTILPLGTLRAGGNIPSRPVMDPIGYSAGMPGSKVGQ